MPSMDELNTTLVPTLKWCPKAARGEFARELATLWNRLNENSDDVRLWTLEFMFARCILPAGRGPRAGDAYSMARLVRERLRRWRAGEYSVLWQEAVNLTKVPKKKGRKRKGEEEKSQEKRNAQRAASLIQEGQLSRAAKALVSLGLDQDSEEALRQMQEKHPQQDVPVAPEVGEEEPTITPVTVTTRDVYEAIRGFKPGTAAGPAGLRGEHLKEAKGLVITVAFP